jgi:hypothetical protein
METGDLSHKWWYVDLSDHEKLEKVMESKRGRV